LDDLFINKEIHLSLFAGSRWGSHDFYCRIFIYKNYINFELGPNFLFLFLKRKNMNGLYIMLSNLIYIL